MKQSLNFSWEYIDNFESSYLNEFPKNSIIIDIPHTNKILPYNYFDQNCYQILSTYRNTFEVNEDLNNKVAFIIFDGVMLSAHIFLNKHDLGKYIGGYLPIKLEVSKYLKNGKNEIIVVVDSKENKDVPPFGFALDYLTFGGIYRKVTLEIKPSTYLSDVFIKTNENGLINIEPTIINKSSNTFLSYALYDKNELIKEFNTNEITINEVIPWDIENPHLYNLKCILTSEFGEDTITKAIGFRSIKFSKDGFYLNNKQIKLIGLNRHQSYPYIGYAASKSLQEDDVKILKRDLGINLVRTSHYPQSEDFLDACDKLGLLVFSETPGWQYIAKDNVIWRNNYKDFIRRMVIKERNHPSIICYGIRIDESQDDHELYQEGNRIAHQLDNTRPTTGVRNFKKSECLEDFYSYNDFSCSSIKHGLDNPKTIKNTKNKPYIVSEYLGHMFPTKPYDKYDDRVHQALLHAKVIDDNYRYRQLYGAIGWCFADYYTHQDFGSGDHICYHGVLDMYRNPKFAAKVYASQNSTSLVFDILSNILPGDRNEALYDKIYIATNADYVEMYTNNIFINKCYPNKKEYKYLPHPLIIIDNLIGNSFDENEYSVNEKKMLAKILNYVAINGFNKIPLKYKLYILSSVYIKHHKSYEDLVNYWNKYVASWGGNLKVYTFKAFKNDECVAIKQIGPSSKVDILFELNKEQLINEETYDTLKIKLSLVDQYRNICTYSKLPFKITTKGPIELLSPSLISLEGGMVSIYIKSKNKNGIGHIFIESINYKKEISIKVIKAN